MRSFIPVALLLALLLGGCGQTAPDPQPSEATQTTDTSTPARLDGQSRGSVTTYTLEQGSCARILGYQEGRCVLLTTDGQICLFQADTMEIENSRVLACAFPPDDASILVRDDQISYFDSNEGAYVTLGKNLTRISAVTIRDTIVAGPIMAEDFSTVYYCTADGVRALDMATGNSRMLRQEHGRIVSLDALLFDGSILRYTRQEEDTAQDTVFIRTDDGSQVELPPLDGPVTTWDDSYAGVMEVEQPMGLCRLILTGQRAQAPQRLDVGNRWESVLFPGEGTALVQTVTENGLLAELYRLSDGVVQASRIFENQSESFRHGWFDGTSLWLWNDDDSLLHRWNTAADACTGESCLAPYYTLSDPDEAGLESADLRAQRLSQIYGISITLTQGDNRTNGADYDQYPDLRPGQYLSALSALHEALESLPEGLCALLGADGQLSIELVDEFDPAQPLTSGTGSLELEAPRVIRVSICPELKSIFYHELYHAMELTIQSRTNILERWSQYNPDGFAYTGGNSALEPGEPTESTWLEPESSCFADEFCLVSAREDRAQTFLYAMLDDQQSRFQTEAMQGKLALLSKAFRAAFPDYGELEQVFRWEQYLDDETPWK